MDNNKSTHFTGIFPYNFVEFTRHLVRTQKDVIVNNK